MSSIVGVISARVALHRQGKELHGPCPMCNAGKDRLVVWPEKDRAWCRQCKEGGSAEWWNWRLNGVQFKAFPTTHGKGQESPPAKVVWTTTAQKAHQTRRGPPPPNHSPCPPELLDQCKTPEFRAALEAADDDTRETLIERAAIMEFDSGLSRVEAERATLAQVSIK